MLTFEVHVDTMHRTCTVMSPERGELISVKAATLRTKAIAALSMVILSIKKDSFWSSQI